MPADISNGLISQATLKDLERISEIYIFNYRLNFYPIFKNDDYYFEELTVSQCMKTFEKSLLELYVYDDGVVKGFIQVKEKQVKKLFVEPILQSQGIGSKLLQCFDVDYMWVLEANERAIAFYKKHGFDLTNIKLPEADDKYLVLMKKGCNVEF